MMAGTFLKCLIPGVVTVIGGTALALSMTSAPIATDLGARVETSLSGDFGWTSIRIDGRDAIVSGTATTQQMIDDAVLRIADVHGVRAVTSEIVLAEFVSPFPFAATLKDGATILSGGYPSEAVHAAILADAAGATDETRLLSGAPDAATFESGAKFGLSALSQFDQGEIKLADLSLSVTGRAKSTEAFGDLQALRDSLPSGIQLAALTITPPLASPYVWTASYDGTKLAISGNVPDEGIEAQFRLVPPANVAVSTSLTLASGEPAAFNANALELLKTLLLLERGDLSITDGLIALSGAPASAEIADQVTASVTRLGGTVKLEPPRVADFGLAIDKKGEALIFSGFVPDAATRDRLAALDDADVDKLSLARGAPERFASALDFGLQALGHLSEGRFELKGTRLSLGGRASSVADLMTVNAMVAEGAPQGLSLAVAELRPPFADPFVFSAVKGPGGAIAITGYVPDESSRLELHGKIADLASDTADPADGAPDDFAFLAGKGLAVLALLDTGSLTYDGANWSIDGAVDTPKKGFAADAAYSIAGLRTMGWTYSVRLPPVATLPIISPYVWRAQKNGEAISFSGFSPSDEFKDYLKGRAAAAADATVLGAGAPADFDSSAAAGIDALLALDEGSLGLSGTRWVLTGEVADAASREAIQTALSGQVNAANWQITIQARDSAPVVSPYLWSATKAPNGLVDLAGYLPSPALQGIAAIRAVNVGRDTSVIASGEPAGFSDDLLAGLEALSYLTNGKASFDGSRWILTGEVASQQQGEAAIAAIAKGSRNGSLWTSAISGYMPPAPPSSEPQSSEKSSSSEEPVSSQPAISSEEPASSLDPISSDESALSSEEPASIVSVEPLSSEEQGGAEESDRGLTIIDPLPTHFLFEARKDSGQPVALLGGVPAAATAIYFGMIAGGAPTDGLVPQTGLPTGFIARGTAGLRALLLLNEGRLGFDGTKWWLRGMAEEQAALDAAKAAITALSDGADWSVFVDLLAPIEICRDHVAALERRNAITFLSGSAKLAETSLPVIDELAVDLAVCPEASVHVEGHTDADGAEDLNLALSVARAESVVDALIVRGVAIERLYAEGFGESQPIAANETRDGKAQNRRIAFSISEE